MKISARGVAAITRFEGCRTKAYKDTAGIWTIGYGHTGPDVVEGQEISISMCEHLLFDDLARFEAAVTKAVGKLPITQNQFDAMVCLAFNIGTEAFRKSTLVKMLKAGDVRGAADQFKVWRMAGGRIEPGLVKRREAERKLFMS